MSHRDASILNRSPFALLVAGLICALFAVLVASRPVGASEEPAQYVVRIHTYYRAEGGAIDVAETETTVSAQYFVNAHKWDASAIPISVRYNPVGEPADYGLATVLQQSIGTWNAVTPSTFSFTWAGGGTGPVGTCGGSISLDGQNTVKFEALPGVVLGQTCTVWNSNQGANAKLVEFDMQLDSDANTWSSAPATPAGKYDLYSTVLHELGHAAGLGHSAQSTAVMFATIGGGVQRRVLTPDDIAGLQAAYPGGGTATPTATQPTPTPTSSPVPTAVPTSLPSLTNRIRAPLLARD